MTDALSPHNLIEHTSRVAAAYIAQHKSSLEELPQIITTLYQALSGIHANASRTLRTFKTPFISIEDSVHDDYLVCLEDGKKLHMLKRHLTSKYDMTLDQYRERWNLPHDYPSVSPSYARRRSAIAVTIGLGKKGRGKAKNKAA
jgi:predicted transcriptional regulator